MITAPTIQRIYRIRHPMAPASLRRIVWVAPVLTLFLPRPKPRRPRIVLPRALVGLLLHRSLFASGLRRTSLCAPARWRPRDQGCLAFRPIPPRVRAGPTNPARGGRPPEMPPAVPAVPAFRPGSKAGGKKRPRRPVVARQAVLALPAGPRHRCAVLLAGGWGPLPPPRRSLRTKPHGHGHLRHPEARADGALRKGRI